MEDIIELTNLPFFNEHECLEIIKYIEEKENYLKQNLKDEFDKRNKIHQKHQQMLYGKNDETSSYMNHTTRLHNYYNFFEDNPKYISRLEKILKNKFPRLNYPLIVQSWANFYKKNQNIKWHKHSRYPSHNLKGLTLNIIIGGDENLGITYAFPYKDRPRYKYHHEKNKLGHIQIVDSNIYHMVKSNNSDQKRYTIGMTITEFDIRQSKSFIYDSAFCDDALILFDDKTLYEIGIHDEKKRNLFNYS